MLGLFFNFVFMEEKEYDIPIRWESYKRYKVIANTLEGAVLKALKQFLSEPDDNYLEDSFEIDEIIYDETDESFDIHKIYKQL